MTQESHPEYGLAIASAAQATTIYNRLTPQGREFLKEGVGQIVIEAISLFGGLNQVRIGPPLFERLDDERGGLYTRVRGDVVGQARLTGIPPAAVTLEIKRAVKLAFEMQSRGIFTLAELERLRKTPEGSLPDAGETGRIRSRIIIARAIHR